MAMRCACQAWRRTSATSPSSTVARASYPHSQRSTPVTVDHVGQQERWSTNWWTAPPASTKSGVAAIRLWAFMSNSPRSGGHLLASVRRGYESAARSRQNAGKHLARVELRPIWRDESRSEPAPCLGAPACERGHRPVVRGVIRAPPQAFLSDHFRRATPQGAPCRVGVRAEPSIGSTPAFATTSTYESLCNQT